MYWNHRVFKTKTNYNTEEVYLYSIREVYYDTETDKIIGWTADEIAPYGESLEELKQNLAWFLDACDKPTLEVDPEDDNRLLGIELGEVDYDQDGEYVMFNDIEELLADLGNEDDDE